MFRRLAAALFPYGIMEISAYHESGHAYMATYVGARVRLVTIDPELGDGADRFGDTHVEWNIAGWSDELVAEKSLWVALAGPAVEIIYTGDPYHPGLVAEWADDWDEAVEQALVLHKDRKQALEYLEQTTLDLITMLRQDRHWAPVAALADHLLAHDTLEMFEIESLLHNWLR